MTPSLDTLLRLSASPEDYLKKVEKTQRALEWQKAMQDFNPDPRIVERLSRAKERATVACFSASWCKDCLKHVPALVKTLQKTEKSNIRLVMLDYDQNKKIAGELGVEAIPTFIVFGGSGTEIGRIIESPSPPFKSVEDELASKLSQR
ncbi:MAG: thioredoxin family protein [Promethearchaeati archaeon SRVP18_Atabeyarchaeia-1]